MIIIIFSLSFAKIFESKSENDAILEHSHFSGRLPISGHIDELIWDICERDWANESPSHIFVREKIEKKHGK